MTANPSLTAAGSIVGTLHYAAPEQLEGGRRHAQRHLGVWMRSLRNAHGRAAVRRQEQRRINGGDSRTRTSSHGRPSAAHAAGIGAHRHAMPREGSGSALAKRARSRSRAAMDRAKWGARRISVYDRRFEVISQCQMGCCRYGRIGGASRRAGARWFTVPPCSRPRGVRHRGSSLNWFDRGPLMADLSSSGRRWNIASNPARISSTAARILPGTQNAAGLWSPILFGRVFTLEPVASI